MSPPVFVARNATGCSPRVISFKLFSCCRRHMCSIKCFSSQHGHAVLCRCITEVNFHMMFNAGKTRITSTSFPLLPLQRRRVSDQANLAYRSVSLYANNAVGRRRGDSLRPLKAFCTSPVDDRRTNERTPTAPIPRSLLLSAITRNAGNTVGCPTAERRGLVRTSLRALRPRWC